MENLIIFIIIMVISSLLSKNKKKKAEEKHTQKEKNIFYEKTVVNNPPPKAERPVNLRELLDSLKNLEEKKSPPPVQKKIAEETIERETAEPPSFEESFHETVHEEAQPEEYSYEERFQPKETPTEESYDEKIEYSKAVKEMKASEDHPSGRSTGKKYTKILFGNGFNLKEAVIASEILNRKYT